MEKKTPKGAETGTDIVVAPSPLDEERALLMQTLSQAQVDFLLQRTPPGEIKTRQGAGGRQFSYVEHGWVTERLNLVFGFNWDFEIVDKQVLDDEVIVQARLTVRTHSGDTIIKTHFGGAEIKRFTSGQKSGRPLSIADDYKAAASDALKKCATLLGIGLDLYGSDSPTPSNQQQRQDDRPPRYPTNGNGNSHANGNGHTGGGGGGASYKPKGDRIGQDKAREIVDLALQAGVGVRKLVEHFGVVSVPDLTHAQGDEAVRWLNGHAFESDFPTPTPTPTPEPAKLDPRDPARLAYLQGIKDHARRIGLRDVHEADLVVQALAHVVDSSTLSTADLGDVAAKFAKIKDKEQAMALVDAWFNAPAGAHEEEEPTPTRG